MCKFVSCHPLICKRQLRVLRLCSVMLLVQAPQCFSVNLYKKKILKPLQNVVEVLPVRVNVMLGTCSGLELPVFKLLFSSVCHPPLSVSWQRASTARLPPSSSVSLRADNLQRASPDLRERKGYEHQPVPVFSGAGHGRRMARVFKNYYFFLSLLVCIFVTS